jgi:hypothetical protein
MWKARLNEAQVYIQNARKAASTGESSAISYVRMARDALQDLLNFSG